MRERERERESEREIQREIQRERERVRERNIFRLKDHFYMNIVYEHFELFIFSIIQFSFIFFMDY